MGSDNLDELPKTSKTKTGEIIKHKSKRAASCSDTSDTEQFEEKSDLCQDIDLAGNDYGKYEKYKKDKKWKLDKIPHHLLPSFNLTQHNDINDLREFPLLRVSLPHSVYVSPRPHNYVDVCHRRTIALSAYMVRLKKIRTVYLSTKSKKKQVRKDEKKGIYNRNLIDFTVQREVHPDKYFSTDYDFYYTSGNLAVNAETQRILHASGENMERLSISLYSLDDGILKVQQKGKVNLLKAGNDDSEIFQLQFSKSQSDLFFLRQKHCVSLYKYTDRFEAVKKFRSKKVPFISFAQDKVNENHLAISNLEQEVRIYDLEKSAPLQIVKIEDAKQTKTGSNWNMITSWDSNMYLYAGCRRFYFIDTRIPESEWQNNYCGYEEDNYCSNFCSLALSSFDNLFYVGSSHQVYCVDKRYMSANIESENSIVSRWTHQMTCLPLMMDTKRHDDFEYVVLQSPVSSDLRICENIQYLKDSDVQGSIRKKPRTEEGPKYEYKSPCLPFMPTSLENVFQEARSNGKCVKPGSGIEHRIKACITGLRFVGDSPNPSILTATSNGDLFARRMFNPSKDKHRWAQATADDVMTQFEQKILHSVKSTPIVVTQVCDLSGISKAFRCPILSGSKQEDEASTVLPKRKYLGRWQKSVRSLYKYKDALASDLLSIWDVEEEDDIKDSTFTTLNQTSLADSKSIVSGWLNNEDIAHSTMVNMTSIPMDVFYSSTAALETPVNETSETNNISQVQLEQTISNTKSKGLKKKSRYIKGF